MVIREFSCKCEQLDYFGLEPRSQDQFVGSICVYVFFFLSISVTSRYTCCGNEAIQTDTVVIVRKVYKREIVGASVCVQISQLIEMWCWEKFSQ